MKNTFFRFQIILNKTLHADFILPLSVQRLNKTHSWLLLPGFKKNHAMEREEENKSKARFAVL